MASPMPSAPMGNWGGNGQAVPPPPFTGPVESGDGGVIIKTMGLKVTYAFADSGESFLARYPELLTVRTVTIDDKHTVGMVDLQMCVRAVVKCSPELLSNATRDFAVYAYDYSEPDEPLVGQGLLGWIVNNSDGKQIIGRATRNPLSAFSNGVKEILEIKLKLKPVAAMAQPHYEPEPRPDLRHSYQRSESHASVEIQPARPAEGALTPSSHAEASNTSRKSRATGRPRGRPRKQPRAESQGNTSGYEDGTDGDDGPAKKKRATVMTQVTSNINAPFGGGPESLRVTASTAGSLRTLRPMGISVEAPMGSHMQDVPRAPTPVPERGPMMPQTGKPTNSSKLRRQSTLSQAATPPANHNIQSRHLPCPQASKTAALPTQTPYLPHTPMTAPPL
ncbi:hypothetical protein ColKHC_02370 [Colletotrichum higginsianum]|nr:hypothetical protein ColKHC_02370 [Colletotrichum higginsianum]